ncbi:MAG: ArsC/Spx/MgsR family protein [Paracoccaceae bacterium]
MILYGIPTCDTCRKARKELAAAGHEVVFRDVRAEPLSGEDIARFEKAFGDRLINRSSATWRGLSETGRTAPAAALLAAHPTLMKRPLIEAGDTLTLGWGAAEKAAFLK